MGRVEGTTAEDGIVDVAGVLAAVSAAVLVVGADGRVVASNPAADALLAVDGSSVVGAPLGDLVDLVDLADPNDVGASADGTLLTGGEGPTPARLRAPGGDRGPVEVWAAPLGDGSSTVITVLRGARPGFADDLLGAVLGELIIDDVLGRLAELAARELGAALVTVAFHPVDGALSEAVPTGAPHSLSGLGAPVLPPWGSGTDPWACAHRDRTVVTVTRPDHLPADVASAAHAEGLGPGWVLPLLLPASGEVVGSLTVWFPAGVQPGSEQRHSAEYAARVAALSLERWRYERQLTQAARQDPLTGLANRTQFFSRLRVAAEHASPEAPTAVLSVDLDGFKAVNDSYGHEAGDRLLTALTGRLRRAVRPTDLVARLGGDEFAVVCPAVSGPEEAGVLAGRLVAVLSGPVAIGELRVSVGASIGIALAPEDGDDPEQLLRVADSGLYRAKAEGRGRWCRVPPTPGEHR